MSPDASGHRLPRKPLRWLVLAALLASSLTIAQTAPPASAHPPVKIIVQQSPLAGYQFHAAPALWPRLRIGDPLALVREADNRHDRYAVRVEWQGQVLGYLPRAENRAVAEEMDRGGQVSGHITALAASGNPWQRIRIEVSLTL